jgi:hypothetical protein
MVKLFYLVTFSERIGLNGWLFGIFEYRVLPKPAGVPSTGISGKRSRGNR